MGEATGPRSQGRDEPWQRPDAQREAAERASALAAWTDIEWIACSDGKARPAQRAILRMANGLSNRMVCRCNRGLAFVSKAAEEGVSYAAESNSSTTTSVRSVLVCDGAQALPGRGLGVHEQLPAAEVLQSGLHVEGVRGTNQGAQREELTPAVWQGCEGGMRGVWKDKHSACPSCGRESFEQLAVQFEDLVREMPPGSTFAQLLGAEGSAFMQALRKAGDADRALLDTQHPGAEVWRSLADEEKDRLQVRFGEGCWTLESRVFPLSSGLPAGLVRGGDRSLAPDADQSAEARVMRLRGYGNAVVPQLAAAFVLAALEVHP